MTVRLKLVFFVVNLSLFGWQADAALAESGGDSASSRVARERERGDSHYAAALRYLEIPSYGAFLNRNCSPYKGVYVVDREDSGDAESENASVVEVIRGPWREQVRLGPIGRRLTSSRLVVYLSEEGIPSDESPLVVDLPYINQRRETAICHPHPEEHPLTLYTRAMVRFWDEQQIDLDNVFALLSSEELPEVWAGCDMRLGTLPRDRVADWDRVGAFLSQALAIGGAAQQRLDRPPFQRTGDGVEDSLRQGLRRESGDARSIGCYKELLSALKNSLLTACRECEWRNDALRVLVDAANHDDRGVRGIGCTTIGLDLRCDENRMPNPRRLSHTRALLDMPMEPTERPMWNDRDIHPARYLFPMHCSPDMTGEEDFPGKWDYFLLMLEMRGYAPETSLDGGTVAVPIDVDSPVVELRERCHW